MLPKEALSFFTGVATGVVLAPLSLPGFIVSTAFDPIGRGRAAISARGRPTISVERPSLKVTGFIEERIIEIPKVVEGKQPKIILDIKTTILDKKTFSRAFGTLEPLKKTGEFKVDLIGSEVFGQITGKKAPRRGLDITGRIKQTVKKDTVITEAELNKISRDINQATLGSDKLIPSKQAAILTRGLQEGGKRFDVSAIVGKEFVPKELFGAKFIEKTVEVSREITPEGSVKIFERTFGKGVEPPQFKSLLKELGVDIGDIPKGALKIEANLLKFLEKASKKPTGKDFTFTKIAEKKLPGLPQELRGFTRGGRGKVDVGTGFKLSSIEKSALAAGREAGKATRGVTERIKPITSPARLAPRGVKGFMGFDIPITVPIIKQDRIGISMQAIGAKTTLDIKSLEKELGLTKTVTKIATIPKFKIGFGEITMEATKSLSAVGTAQDQVLGQMLKTQLKLDQRLAKEFRIDVPKTIETIKPFVPVIPGSRTGFGIPFPKEKPPIIIGRDKQFYNVFLKPQGRKKFFRANRADLTKGEAEDLGAFISDTSLSAQFKVRKQKGRMKVTKKSRSKRRARRLPFPIGYFGGTRQKFRGFKIRRGTKIPLKNQFIERRSFRLDTTGEVNRITAAKRVAQLRRQKPLKKKKTTKRVKSRSNKRKSTRRKKDMISQLMGF